MCPYCNPKRLVLVEPELAAQVGALTAALQDWRSWAQFIYLGGGPLSTTDDNELRRLVCEVQDKDIAAARQHTPKP